MEKFKHLQKIKEIYANGENIIQHLKGLSGSKKNSIEDILISYDFQAGSYTQNFSKNRDYNNKYCTALANIINNIPQVNSILEVGVGEATTLNTLIRNLERRPSDIFGFDISWSRLKFAQELLNGFDIPNVKLFTANLFEIPLPDNSIDVVYTSHSIEPNGGREKEALAELYRITKGSLILLEPSFEFASDEGKSRMKQHGYVTELYATAQALNYNVVEHRLFDYYSNPLNPTGLIIIDKQASAVNNSVLVCPISHTALNAYNSQWLYSKESLLAYPILDNIPCLLKENSILATHLLTDYNQFKTEHRIDF